MTTVPCVLRDADARQLLEWAIIENVQRSDLNPIDRAKAYRDAFCELNDSKTRVPLGTPEPEKATAGA